METKQTTRTIQQVRIALALEKAAKDAYYATAKSGVKADKKLYDAMVIATKARQAAMTAYGQTVTTRGLHPSF